MQRFWRVDGALFHLEHEADLFLCCDLIARDCDFADVILWPLRYHDRDNHWAVFAALLADVFHLHVDVAVVLIEFFNAIEVLL